jgi:hypothetical protein
MQSPTEARYLHGLRASGSSFSLQTVAKLRPGDPYSNGFMSEPMRCWRMIHARQRQATHRMETPTGLDDGRLIR